MLFIRGSIGYCIPPNVESGTGTVIDTSICRHLESSKLLSLKKNSMTPRHGSLFKNIKSVRSFTSTRDLHSKCFIDIEATKIFNN